jgi:hypothetical protein
MIVGVCPMTDKPQVEEEAAPRLEGNSSASFFLVQMPKLLASAPVVLAILGICYDVGYFAGIGLELFPLFTLSEHLVFAMEAIPALMVLIAAFMWLGFFLFSRAFRRAYGANAGVVIRKVPFSFIFRPTFPHGEGVYPNFCQLKTGCCCCVKTG